jgi:hypothetical protein
VHNTAIPLFINPAAGRGRAGRKLGAIRTLFDAQGIAHSVIQSNAPGDLEQRVYDAALAGTGKLIVAGGDGSIHEAVNGIMRSGKLHWASSRSVLATTLQRLQEFHCTGIRGSVARRAAACRAPPARSTGSNERSFFANGAGVDSMPRSRALPGPIGCRSAILLPARGHRRCGMSDNAAMNIRFNGRATRSHDLANVSNGA